MISARVLRRPATRGVWLCVSLAPAGRPGDRAGPGRAGPGDRAGDRAAGRPATAAGGSGRRASSSRFVPGRQIAARPRR